MATKSKGIKKAWEENPIATTLIGVGVLTVFGLTISRAWGKGKGGRSLNIYRSPEDINKWSPTPLAKKLYADMKGINLFPATEAWAALHNLPQNQQVIDVYNEFNSLYYPESGETLTQWIRGESTDWEGNKKKALQRLDALGLAEKLNRASWQYFNY